MAMPFSSRSTLHTILSYFLLTLPSLFLPVSLHSSPPTPRINELIEMILAYHFPDCNRTCLAVYVMHLSVSPSGFCILHKSSSEFKICWWDMVIPAVKREWYWVNTINQLVCLWGIKNGLKMKKKHWLILHILSGLIVTGKTYFHAILRRFKSELGYSQRACHPHFPCSLGTQTLDSSPRNQAVTTSSRGSEHNKACASSGWLKMEAWEAQAILLL